MRPLLLRTALAAALTATLAACGGDDHDADLVEDLEALGASRVEAECLIDELGADDAERFVDIADADSPPDNADEIVAALDECGVEADGPDASTAEPEETTPPAGPTGPTDEATDGADIQVVAGCLADAGLDATVDEGTLPRIDLLGADAGRGAVFFYAGLDEAADASSQFTDTFGGGEEEFVSGSSGSVAYYYVGPSEEGAVIQECLV